MRIKMHQDYACWRSMIKRKFWPNESDKKYYRKNMYIDPRWIKSFFAFTEDMGLRPDKSYSIDRINSKRGYYKENCRWATKKEQIENRITAKQCLNGHPWTKESIKWTHNGKIKVRRCLICLIKYQKKLQRKKRSDTLNDEGEK